MGEVDLEKIMSLLGEIEKVLSTLREHAKKTKESLMENIDLMGSIKYNFIKVISIAYL